MHVLVTGGAGFIGSNLVDALLLAGHEVCVIDNLAASGGGRREYVSPHARFAEVDVRDKDAVERTFGEFRPEIVLHQAAQTSVVAGARDPDYDADVNVRGMLSLLTASVALGVRKIVFASTAATYGTVERLPADEATPQRPISPYGISKLAAEGYLAFFSRQHGLEYTILRYGNVYGPRQNAYGEGGVVAIFTSRFVNRHGVTINGDGEQTRDFTFVGDVVRANLIAMDHGAGEAFVIGTGVRTSVKRVYDVLAEITGFEAPITWAPRRASEARDSVFDPAKARRLLGWQAEVPLEDGLRRTVAFYDEAEKLRVSPA